MIAQNLFMLWIGFTIGNFLWMWLTTKDWKGAFDRSYFQAAILLAAYFVVLK